jgi:hypothetical protein
MVTFGKKKMWPCKTGNLLKKGSYEIFCMTGQEKGDLLIQVTAWAGFTVHRK